MRSAAKFILGSVLGGLLWFYATPAYEEFLCRAVTPLLHADYRLPGTIAERDDRKVLVRSVTNLSFPNIQIPADELTYNVILFAGLLAMRRGSMPRTALAVLGFVATHVIALLLSIEATYSGRMGAWSNRHYGGHEQDFWTAAEYLYRLAGMFAIAFAAWWLSVGNDLMPLPQPAPGKSSRPD